jgi:hypothetical protein
MKKTELYKLLLCAFLVSAYSCTNLEIEQTDSNFTNLTGEFSGVDPAAGLDGLYNDWRGQIENQADLFALNEVSTDEQLVATRGVDWGDNGVWRNLHDHNWDANHSFVKSVWNNLNQNVFRATAIIDSRSGGTPAQVAQAKFLRAYATYYLVDLYGQAPFRTPDEGANVNPSVKTRSEAFEFAVQDLTEALGDLPTEGPGGAGLNRATKASARFLLAKLYLNKHIFTGTGSPASADMNKVVELVDAINMDGFGLASGYFDIFKDVSDNETIWYVGASVGNRMWNTLHYKQGAPGNDGGGWNGFTTLAEFYDLFEGDANTNVPGSGQEERRGFVPTDGSHFGIGYGFLIGQQYDANGNAMTDRPGNPMIFTKELPGLLGNNEVTGIRTIKYHPENGAFTGHEIVFRYADAHLMKAEAILNGASGNALGLVNELRALRGASPMPALTAQTLLDERGRELYIEQWRRNDQIRLGTWSQTWSYKSNTDPYRVLYPIPSTALISNPNLVQNEGY